MGKKLLTGLLISATALLLLGLILLFSYPAIYDRETSLMRGSQVFKQWVEPDMPVYMKYHFFTYVNADRFLKGQDEKPEVKEVGVLSYREYQKKTDIKYQKRAQKVSYYNNKWYVFDAETSSMAETDTVVIPNILLFTILSSAPNSIERSILEKLINEWNTNATRRNGVSPFFEVGAADFLWGLKDNVLLSLLSPIIGGPTKFGIQTNNSNDGLYQVFTGKRHGNHNRGLVSAWNGERSLDYWSCDAANMLNGTDGSIFPVEMRRSPRLYVFNTQMCRSLFLEAQSGEEDVQGLSLTRYQTTPELFQVDFEDNMCFCEGGDVDRCLGDGLLDVSDCYEDRVSKVLDEDVQMSVIVSGPEFLYASNQTIESIVGFNPNPEIHNSFMNIHKPSGVLLSGAKRIQLNTRLTKFQLNSMSSVPDNWSYILPLFWAEEVLHVDEGVVQSIKSSEKFSLTMTVVSIVLTGLGFLLLLAAIFALIFTTSEESEVYVVNVDRKGEKQPLLVK